ncbi:MAG: RDD family protein [Nanoarchaeota archaeon]|nr:RDD family protein [Nanoarchaeota archaeon]
MKGLNLPKKRVFEVNAGIGKRLMAFGIDLLAVLLVASPLINSVKKFIPIPDDPAGFAQTFDYMNDLLTGNPDILAKVSEINMLVMIVAFLYFVFFEYKLGQTIGKMVLGLYVVPLENQNKKTKLTFWQCIIRNLFVVANFIIVVDMVYFALRNIRLSDQFAKTKVVEVVSA